MALVAVTLLLTVAACIKRGVDIVPFLPPDHTASLEELVAHVNEWASIRSLVLRVDLQFETVESAEEGEGSRYRTAQGRLLLARPERIRLNIEAPVLSASIAEMASDGDRFQLLIHPPDYRALIQGSNDEAYRSEAEKLDDDPALRKAGALVNIRPHHFTSAFLLVPIPIDERHTAAFVEEERIEERDPRPRAKEEARVRKSYHVVTVVRLGERSPRARYWFDRTGELSLARQQVYDAGGRLVSDIRYSEYLPPHAESGVRIASKVRIERPYDNYTVELTVKPDGVMVNRDLPDTAFVVDAPSEWGETVRHIDLDERRETHP